MRCASVRKKGSLEQCTAKPVFGHTLCGRHAKSKHPVLWADVHSGKSKNIVKLQALVRGWFVRKRLQWAGPGVLLRKQCVNDEDLNTFTEKDKVHPFEYFGLEENGKIWWFEYPTIWRWMIQNTKPTNPYTKVPLSVDTRKRLRKIWGLGQRYFQPLVEEAPSLNERLFQRWNVLCQCFEDNGFGDFDPRLFMRLNKNELLVMFQLIYEDIQTVFNDKDPAKRQLLELCSRCRTTSIAHTNLYILQAPYYMSLLLSFLKDPYPLVFIILSALYRI